MTRTHPEEPEATNTWSPLSLALFGGCWVALPGNWPLWRALTRLPDLASSRGTLFIAGFGLMMAVLMTAILCLGAWRGAIKPLVAILAFSAAIGAYFMGTYGVVLDPSMMTSVLQTDPKEVRDLLSPQFAANLLILGALPVALLWRVKVRRVPLAAQGLRNLLAVLACLALLVGLTMAFFAEMSGTMRSHRGLRYLINPLNSYYSLGVIASRASARPAGPPEPIGLGAKPRALAAGRLPPLLVLVVGETARADHFSLNGYARPTNPELSREDVASFRNVTSCGTNTAASLPCMFSALGRDAFQSRNRVAENLLDLVQRAGLAVLWLDNQSGCKGLCERVPNAMAPAALAQALPAMAKELCTEGECYDEALLFDLDAQLARLPEERRARGVLVVLHQMGSHGPAYFRRSPPDRKPFQPECTTAVLQQCALGTVVNAYDNSIAYTDHVLARTIGWLRSQGARYEPSLLYVSDHGESLGENNIYLHGLPYALAPAEQKHVPMVVWFGGAGVAQQADPRIACLRQRADQPLSHDHLFHTVVGLLGIEATEYHANLDAIAPCRGG